MTSSDYNKGKRLRLHVLASGSKGNCSIVQDAATGVSLVIDCGITKRAFMEGCRECGVDVTRVGAIVISHEHVDHTKGVGVVTRGLAKAGVTPVVYVSDAVRAASRELEAVQEAVDMRCFTAGDAIGVVDMEVHPFRTSHDAAESFGFRVEQHGDAIGFMTDTGIVTGEARDALRGCRVLAIEANHDLDMLANGPYPAFLKARISSERGHLSNVQSAELLSDLLHDGLESVIGMHVSQNNNTYRLPLEALRGALSREGHPACAFVGYQERCVSV